MEQCWGCGDEAGAADTIDRVMCYPIKPHERHDFWSCTGTHQRPIWNCTCVSVCVRKSQRQKDKEGVFNGVSQGEAPLFPLIKHAAGALAP